MPQELSIRQQSFKACRSTFRTYTDVANVPDRGIMNTNCADVNLPVAWKCAGGEFRAFECVDCPGVFWIKQALDNAEILKLLEHALFDYPYQADVFRCNKGFDQFARDEVVRSCNEVTDEAEQELLTAVTKILSWLTCGYHHDWDTKIYSECNKSAIPVDFGAVFQTFAHASGCSDFKPEAAIINYYKPSSTIGFHQDISERCLQPLLSLSIGLPALLLIQKVEDAESSKPHALVVESGDLVIFSGVNRLAFHAVPHILTYNNCDEMMQHCGVFKFIDSKLRSADSAPLSNFRLKCLQNVLPKLRINISVRQVMPS